MENYEVKVSSTAQRDFLGVAEYLDTLPPEDAALYFDKIISGTEVLQKSPATCSFVRDTQLRLRGYRVLAVEDYVFFFVMREKTVEIRRVLYAKRQYEHLV